MLARSLVDLPLEPQLRTSANSTDPNQPLCHFLPSEQMPPQPMAVTRHARPRMSLEPDMGS